MKVTAGDKVCCIAFRLLVFAVLGFLLFLTRELRIGVDSPVHRNGKWLDDEELAYANYALYDWSWHGLDQVTLRFYESDIDVFPFWVYHPSSRCYEQE